MIEWMAQTLFEAHIPRLRPTEVQRMIYYLDSADLSGRIATAPTLPDHDGDFLQRWFGILSDRYFMMEVRVHGEYRENEIFCTIQTPYDETWGHEFEWQIIEEFDEVLSLVEARSLRWIDTSCRAPECMVSKDHSVGFDLPVYEASSKPDAAALVDYLSRTEPEIHFTLGPPEPECVWLVDCIRLDGTHCRVGCYPARPMAVKYAVGRSVERGETLLVYSDRASDDPRTYLVTDGKVQRSLPTGEVVRSN